MIWYIIILYNAMKDKIMFLNTIIKYTILGHMMTEEILHNKAIQYMQYNIIII